MALAKVLSCWASSLTWTAHRELSAQVMRGMEAHKVAAHFLSAAAGLEGHNTTSRIRYGQPAWRAGGGLQGWEGGELGCSGYVQGPTVDTITFALEHVTLFYSL